MLRLLLIFSLIFYVLHRFGFFRTISQEANSNRKPPKGGNVHVDASPPKEKKRSGFKGGDYIDFEEVK